MPAGGHVISRSIRLRREPATCAPHDYSQSDEPLLITGPTGTGKGPVAYAIHQRSPRRNAPFVHRLGSEIANELFDSEMFGHKKGAFTHAIQDKRGLLEQAAGGTLFIDDLDWLPVSLQAKLLRVLQDGSFRPVGGEHSHELPVRCRFIFATNKNVDALLADGRLLTVLFHRILGLRIDIAPLRERSDDIPPLVNHFIRQWNQTPGREIRDADPEAIDLFMHHTWDGNVGEQEQAVKVACTHARGDRITLPDLPGCLLAGAGAAAPAAAEQQPGDSRTSAATDRTATATRPARARTVSRAQTRSGWIDCDELARIYEANDGNVRATAEQIGVPYRSLYRILDRCGIRWIRRRG